MNLYKSYKIYMAGHLVMIGTACWKVLEKLGYHNLIVKIFKELYLRNQSQVSHNERINWFFSKSRGIALKLMDSSKMIILGW